MGASAMAVAVTYVIGFTISTLLFAISIAGIVWVAESTAAANHRMLEFYEKECGMDVSGYRRPLFEPVRRKIRHWRTP